MVQAVYIDCTPEMHRVINATKDSVPENVKVFVGNPTADEIVQLATGAQVLFVEHTSLPPQVIARCEDVHTVVFMGTGAGTYIDLDNAVDRKIDVVTTPGYGNRAVAEHAMALLFAAARQVARSDADVRRGMWCPAGGLQLEGLRLAVVGLGGIGACFADMAQALGMDVVAWNRSPKGHSAFNADLDDVLKRADVVSLHLGLNAGTKGIIDARRLKLPKAGFVLINTARAELVDEDALFEGLSNGTIGHAALDVFPVEPLPAGSRYADFANTTLTPHVAYMTDAAYTHLWRQTLVAFETASKPLA